MPSSVRRSRQRLAFADLLALGAFRIEPDCFWFFGGFPYNFGLRFFFLAIRIFPISSMIVLSFAFIFYSFRSLSLDFDLRPLAQNRIGICRLGDKLPACSRKR